MPGFAFDELMLNQVKILLGSVSRFLNTSSNSLLKLYKVLTSAKLYTSDNVITINKPSDLNQLPNNSRLKDLGFDVSTQTATQKTNLSLVKHSIEKTILLNFVNLFTFPCSKIVAMLTTPNFDCRLTKTVWLTWGLLVWMLLRPSLKVGDTILQLLEILKLRFS